MIGGFGPNKDGWYAEGRSVYGRFTVFFDKDGNVDSIRSRCEDCTHTPRPEPKPRQRPQPSSRLKGAAAMVASEAGFGVASDAVVEHRWGICVVCDDCVVGYCAAKDVDTGKTCGCGVPQKIRRKNAICPLRKW